MDKKGSDGGQRVFCKVYIRLFTISNGLFYVFIKSNADVSKCFKTDEKFLEVKY